MPEQSANKQAYQLSEVVDFYRNSRDLQPPEKAILEDLRAQLADFSMLDIGIGAGRTTRHFAPIVRRYVGIDYSREMIEACKHEFGIDHSIFECDARVMDILEADQFDLVLFSFNGIDYVPYADRQTIFNEVIRVSKSEAIFCFSTHNLQHAPELFSFKLHLHPKRFVRELLEFLRKRFENRGVLNDTNEPYAVLSDGAHGFSIKDTIYILPETQVELLRSLGCSDIDVFGFDGKKIPVHQLKSNRDAWLYYRCTLP